MPGCSAQHLWGLVGAAAQPHTDQHGDSIPNGYPDADIHAHPDLFANQHANAFLFPNQDTCPFYSYPRPGLFV